MTGRGGALRAGRRWRAGSPCAARPFAYANLLVVRHRPREHTVKQNNEGRFSGPPSPESAKSAAHCPPPLASSPPAHSCSLSPQLAPAAGSALGNLRATPAAQQGQRLGWGWGRTWWGGMRGRVRGRQWPQCRVLSTPCLCHCQPMPGALIAARLHCHPTPCAHYPTAHTPSPPAHTHPLTSAYTAHTSGR